LVRFRTKRSTDLFGSRLAFSAPHNTGLFLDRIDSMQAKDPRLGRDAFAFVRRLDSLSTGSEIMDAMHEAIGGAEYFCFSTFLRSDQRFEQAMLAVRAPQEWLKIYLECDYAHADPSIRHCNRTFRPFDWADAPYDAEREPKAAELVRRAREFGLHKGYMVPIPTPSGCGFVWIGGRDFAPDAEAKPCIHFMALNAFERMRVIVGISARAPLTAREREVLSWAANGKSAWEIGEILTISKRTVDEHCHTAFRKLGAVNRTHAVAIALRQQLISL
jgi:LuxR family quorum sensing-dependent transcriptional regulator